MGQGLFSFAVRDAYQGACAVTHKHLLRRDLHRLFDLGYVTVTPDYVFRVGKRLGEEFKNGRSYYGLDESRIAVPPDDLLRPDKTTLDWHATTVFQG